MPKRAASDVQIIGSTSIKFKAPHDHKLEFHQYVQIGDPVRLDALGRNNARGTGTRWLPFICNNSDCPAKAYLRLSSVELAVDEAAS